MIEPPQAPEFSPDVLEMEDPTYAPIGLFEDDMASVGPEGESAGSLYSLEQALADIEADPKNTTKYIAVYNMVNKAEKGQTLTAEQRKKVDTLSTAEKQINELEKIFLNAGGPQGRIGGTVASLRGQLTGGQEGAYEQVRKSAVAQIARALGEVGVLTDQDIQRALGAIPKFTDTSDEVQTKLAYIRSILGGAKSTLTSGGGQPDSGLDLETELLNAGYGAF
jgi:hypothetical protein